MNRRIFVRDFKYTPRASANIIASLHVLCARHNSVSSTCTRCVCIHRSRLPATRHSTATTTTRGKNTDFPCQPFSSFAHNFLHMFGSRKSRTQTNGNKLVMTKRRHTKQPEMQTDRRIRHQKESETMCFTYCVSVFNGVVVASSTLYNLFSVANAAGYLLLSRFARKITAYDWVDLWFVWRVHEHGTFFSRKMAKCKLFKVSEHMQWTIHEIMSPNSFFI